MRYFNDLRGQALTQFLLAEKKKNRKPRAPTKLDAFRDLILRRKRGGHDCDVCWVWTGPTKGGYGVLGGVLLHRCAWAAWHGRAIPKDRDLHHCCKEKACFNPTHLEALPPELHALRHKRNPPRLPADFAIHF